MGLGESIDHYVRAYGDLLFDLCGSVLPNPVHSQTAFRGILKSIKLNLGKDRYQRYERSWVLKIACAKLLSLCERYGNYVSPKEQIKLDANGNVTTRLKHFNSYFHRLKPSDQLLLLLKDKYGISYSEISNAMAIPEASLKIQRQQALRALEEWLWNGK